MRLTVVHSTGMITAAGPNLDRGPTRPWTEVLFTGEVAETGLVRGSADFSFPPEEGEIVQEHDASAVLRLSPATGDCATRNDLSLAAGTRSAPHDTYRMVRLPAEP